MAPADRLRLGRHIDGRDDDLRGRVRPVHDVGHATGSTASGAIDDALDLDPVLAVGLLEVDPDELLARRRDVLADVVGADRQLAMAAIDEHRQADRLRPAEVDERVHRGADRPAGVQHVVDEDDRPAVDARRQLRALDDRLLGDHRQVVAVERDVERPDRDVDALVLGDGRGDAAGERHAAPLDADEQQAVGARLLLDDLVGKADRRATDLVGGHDPASGHRSFPASQGHAGGLTGPQPKGQPQGYRGPEGQ